MTVLSQLGITVLNELKLLNTHINYEKKLAGLEAEEEEEEEKDEVRTEQTITSVSPVSYARFWLHTCKS